MNGNPTEFSPESCDHIPAAPWSLMLRTRYQEVLIKATAIQLEKLQKTGRIEDIMAEAVALECFKKELRRLNASTC